MAPKRYRDSLIGGDDDTARRFIRSALTDSTSTAPAGWFEEWFAQRVDANDFEVDRIPFRSLTGWNFDEVTGNLRHDSGRFFSIEGLMARTDRTWAGEWTQPIIVQPEIGALGILAKEIGGVLHFLMQAKMEPGNVNTVQLSPTVQATRSNYTGVHHGARIKYLEYFISDRHRVLVDTLQSEQSAWFLHKRNRNIVVEVTDDVPVDDDFCWLTLGQLFRLLRHPHLVNMDARTVIACMPFTATWDEAAGAGGDRFAGAVRRSLSRESRSRYTDGQVLAWLTDVRARREMVQQRVPMRTVLEADWYRDDAAIAHRAGKYFAVIAVDVRASNREVGAWRQPLVAPCEPGLVAFLVKEIDGVMHALVHARVDVGSLNVAELAPSLQCQPANYRDVAAEFSPLFLDYVRSVPPEQVRYDVMQSEEGGRFFHALNRYMVVEVGDEFPVETPDQYIWMTLHQLAALLPYGNYLNVEARTLLACIKFLGWADAR
ncbi:NDP-hexose 2,3-dehydratase family protein [Nocardia sp. NPDC050175]|uniref:NDP-hexose 2,3-dehydratase family protein n=1 Tax=Nocardia sp. NPDC050175 TaxID=3364317 RepID=UPI0037B1DA96